MRFVSKFSSFSVCMLLVTALHAQVTLVNSSYSSGVYINPSLNHVNGVGNDRILLFIAANEYDISSPVQIASIDYGGQPMTLGGIEEIYTVSGNCWAEIEVYYILESQILAATSTSFNITYSNTTNLRAIKHTAVTFANVDQASPLGQIVSASNVNTSAIQSLPLSGNANDMLISILSGGQNGSYSMTGGFNNIYNHDENTHTYASFNRLFQSSCTSITPSATINYFSMNRQSLLSLVLQSNNPTPATINLFKDTTLCQGAQLTLNATTPNATYIWQDNSTNPTFTVSQQGTYWVNVVVNGCSMWDTIQVNYAPLPYVNLGNDTLLCEGQILTLNATTQNVAYLWQNNSTNPTFTVSQQGTYWLEVNTNGCRKRDTIDVQYAPSPVVTLGNDTVICQGQSLMLDATTLNATYLWNNNSTNPTFSVSQEGVYSVTVTGINGCRDSAMVTVFEQICCTDDGLYLPNAFSPNSDGENDLLQLFHGGSGCVQEMSLTIFDRWGKKIFKTTDPDFQWDGSYNGNKMNTAVFVYNFNATLASGGKISKRGNVSLIK